MHFLLLGGGRYTIEFKIFVLVFFLLHALIGVGLTSRSLWGFYFFKYYLYVLYIAFPIGTFIAHKSLKLLEDKNYKKMFR